jgi:hypothetical protein
MAGTGLCVNMYKSVQVIFEPPCILHIVSAFVGICNSLQSIGCLLISCERQWQ